MAVFHDEVEIEDFEYDEESETYFYPCPCGDQFQITKVGIKVFDRTKRWVVGVWANCLNRL